MTRNVLRVAAGLSIAFLILATGPVSAQTNEAQMASAAQNFVAAMQRNKLHSGTVLDFTDLQGASNELGRYFAQDLADQLVATGVVSVVDRSNLQMLMREHRMSADGLINPEMSRKLGNLIGVDTTIVGSVVPIGRFFRVSMRAVAIESGKVVSSQIIELSVPPDIAALFHRGVSSSADPGAAPSPGDEPQPTIRADTLRLTGTFITVVPNSTSCSFVGIGNTCLATVAVVLENLSGRNVEIGVVSPSLAVGSCTNTQSNTTGISATPRGLEHNPRLSLLPSGGRIAIRANVGGECVESLLQSDKADVSLTFLLLTNGGIESLPLTAADVPVRVLRNSPLQRDAPLGGFIAH